jgi:alpha-L-fucosidase
MLSQLAILSISISSALSTTREPQTIPGAAQGDEAESATGSAAADDPRLAWWREARFGMFVHWGVYAVAAGEWKGQTTPSVGEWIMDTLHIPRAEYETLAPRFDPVMFDAATWVKIAKDAGMRYIVITSKHHDGFCMFDSKLTDWDIVDATPFDRDVLRELAGECRRQGVRLCFYHSIMDWHHPDARGEHFERYREHLKGQIRELLTGYGPIGILWFDGEWIDEWTAEMGEDMYAYCRSLQPDLIVNNRVGKGRAGMSAGRTSAGDYGTPEQEIPGTGLPGYLWETCMTMNDTWGFKRADQNWKSARELIRDLVDIASKGGNFLLNVGPTGEGEIPAPSVERLAAMGRWMRNNGEAIYGTSASPFRRLAWGRATAKPGKLYLHVFDWPADGRLVVPGLRNEVSGAVLISDPTKRALGTAREGDDLVVSLPAAAPDPDVSVVALDLLGEPDVVVALPRQADDGTLVLRAADAEIHGATAHYEYGGGKDNVGFWTDASDWVSWVFEATRPGRYDVVVDYACDRGTGGASYVVAIGKNDVRGSVNETGSWTAFQREIIGTLDVTAAGRATLAVRPIAKPGPAVMNLRAVELHPARADSDDVLRGQSH